MLEQVKNYRAYIFMAGINLVVLVGMYYLLRREEPRVIQVTTPVPRATNTPQIIQVQVRGAVNQPGVYDLVLGARVSDALERAGGARPEADLNAVNLARKLSDGEEIVVPERVVALPTSAAVSNASADSPAKTVAPTSKAATATPGKININTASVEQLTALPRVGATLAQRIVDYRAQHGPFKRIEDVKNVKGIGDALFNNIKDLITLQ